MKYLKEQRLQDLPGFPVCCDALAKDQRNITVNLLGKNSAAQLTFFIIFVMKINHWQLLEEQIKSSYEQVQPKRLVEPSGKLSLQESTGTYRDHVRLSQNF